MEITLASLCCRPSRADSSFQQRAQRTPLTRLAVMASPFPEPHNAPVYLTSRNGLGDGPDETRVVDRWGCGIRSFVEDLVAKISEELADGFFVLETGMVGANGNFHTIQLVIEDSAQKYRILRLRKKKCWQTAVR